MAYPLYDAYLLDDFDGITAISLVDDPAVESFFTAYDKNKQPMMYSVEDKVQKRVLGVVMRADYPIYRSDENMGEFYIKYSKDTIRKMAQRMFMFGTENNVNLDHCHDCWVSGVKCEEVFIKDSEKGIDPKGYEDISDGSMFATFKIDDDSIWDMIMAGKYQGFSLEGYFTLQPSEDQKFSKVKKENKDVMTKIKEALKKLLAQFGTVVTDNGNLNYEGDELAVGAAVTDDEGNPVADGDYKTEDGKVITVKDGKVESIADAPVEDKPVEEDVEAKKKCKAEDEKPMDTPVEDTPVDDVDDEDVKIKELQAQIDALKSEIEAIKAKLNEPAADPVAEAFEKSHAVKAVNRAAEYAKFLKD